MSKIKNLTPHNVNYLVGGQVLQSLNVEEPSNDKYARLIL